MRRFGTPGAPILASVLTIVLATGCGYTIRTPFSPEVQTVYVPIFKSASFRRDLNLQLTELVQKEIERRTPFKVVGNPEDADTTLDGAIMVADKNIMVESPNNLPRELMSMMTVQVRWINNRNPDPKEKSKPYTMVIENMVFFPEIGETTNLGFQTNLQRIARDIVNMMEQPVVTAP